MMNGDRAEIEYSVGDDSGFGGSVIQLPIELASSQNSDGDGDGNWVDFRQGISHKSQSE